MMTETIQWHDVNESLPDDDTTVLVYIPKAIDVIWMGQLSGEEWFWADGSECSGLISQEVTHWAHLPVGPGGGRTA